MNNYTRMSICNNIDMLKGNINRMCVTSDIDELNKMFSVAVKRLVFIHDENKKRLEESGE